MRHNWPIWSYQRISLDNGIKLFRIDGNHRLSAANDAKPGEAKYSLPTPFCIVLHDDALQAQRFEKVVFHNINAKQIPLTSEENLTPDSGDWTAGSLFDDKTLLESSRLRSGLLSSPQVAGRDR